MKDVNICICVYVYTYLFLLDTSLHGVHVQIFTITDIYEVEEIFKWSAHRNVKVFKLRIKFRRDLHILSFTLFFYL